MSQLPSSHQGAAPPDASMAFRRIVCGVEAGHGREAVDQAIALSAPGGELTFVCVHDGDGRARAAEALREAVEAAADAGIDAAASAQSAANPGAVLLEAATGADLLVVASHGQLAAGGAALGSTASIAVHDSAVPVLVARRPPEGAAFPGRILVATDGSPDAHRAVELAGRIARRYRSQVDLLSVDPAPHGKVDQIAVDIVELTDQLGAEPTVLREAGRANDRILEIAEHDAVSLVVLGSRGQTGLRALGSVSEHVAHRAPCSVLIART